MKKFFLSAAVFLSIAVHAQSDDIKPAAKGVVYGEAVTHDGAAVDINNLKLTNGAFEGKVTGTVKEICKEMGCWLTLEKKDGTAVMIKTKDHAYFMPQNIVGKTVVVEGTAAVKEVTEAQRRHAAEDAGKSKAEIATIKGSTQEVQLIASGVEVLD